MRKLMWFSIGFTFACAMGVWILPTEWLIPVIAAGTAAAGIFWTLGIRRAAIAFLGLGIGLTWFSLFVQYRLIPAQERDGVAVSTTFTATDYSYETSYCCAVEGEFTLGSDTYRVKLYINSTDQLSPGDQLRGTFRLRYTAPGGYQDPTHHAGDGIFFLGYQTGEADLVKCAGNSIKWFAARLRREIRELLRAGLPEDVFPFAQALLLGDGSELDYETETALSVSGIRHIIAVSGLHVSMLFGFLRGITLKRRYLTALLSAVVLPVFAAVAGFSPSVNRACLMMGLMILAQVLNREYDSPTALAFAVLVMLGVNPLVITSVGFQMSVASVMGILMLSDRISGWMKEKLPKTKPMIFISRLKNWFVSSVSVSVSATVLTMPLSALYFGTVSLVGVVTNLVALWAVNLAFIGLLLLCAIGSVWLKGAAFFGTIVAWPMRYVVFCGKTVAEFPLAAVYTQSIYIVAWLIFAYILLAAFLLSRKKQPVILACCAVIGLCASLFASWVEPLYDNVRLDVLNVGQGQCLILHCEGRTFLIDCGGDQDECTGDLAAQTLLSRGIRKLDGIIVTHPDRDHAGGIPYLLTRMDAELLILPATVEESSAAEITEGFAGEVTYLHDELQITVGEGKMTVFGPLFVNDSNENSLCVLFESKNCDILITGDRTQFGERILLREHDLPDVDLLIAGHHGSKYSTCQELLDTVTPETVIISVGKDNSYGHPAEELLERLENFGCVILRTDQMGTITYRR